MATPRKPGARRGRPPGSKKSLITDPDRIPLAIGVALQIEAELSGACSERKALEKVLDNIVGTRDAPRSGRGMPARRPSGESHIVSRIEKKIGRPLTDEETDWAATAIAAFWTLLRQTPETKRASEATFLSLMEDAGEGVFARAYLAKSHR